MTLMRWSPCADLESVNRQLGHRLDDSSFSTGIEGGHWAPSVDICETDDALVLQAELPGMEKKNVHLEMKNGVLTISGERHYKKDVKEENVHRVERSYGKFTRSFSLPANIDGEKVDATMKNGVLEIRLSKRENARPKAIVIH